MYFFSYFREFVGALHLAYSYDLFNWTDLTPEEPLLEAQVGGKYWRDPFIMRDQTGMFRLLCTDGWNSPDIILSSSKDLVHWSEQQVIPVMADFPSCQNAWAPECCYNYLKREYMLFWSSTVPAMFGFTPDKSKEYRNHRIFACTTKDFQSFSKTKLYFDPGFNCIDASIAFHDGRYLMAFKDERGDNPYYKTQIARKHILIASTKHLDGNWLFSTTPISPSKFSQEKDLPNVKELWAEGPSIFWDQSSSQWFVFFEYFRAHQYDVLVSTDGVTWNHPIQKLKMPEGVKHGTVFEVKEESILTGLLHR